MLFLQMGEYVMRSKKFFISSVLVLLIILAAPMTLFADSDDEISGGNFVDIDIASLSPDALTILDIIRERNLAATLAGVGADDVDIDTQSINILASADGRSRVNLFWNKVDDSRGYDVYRSTSADELGTKIFTTHDPSTFKYIDVNANVNKTYYYTVQARTGNADVADDPAKYFQSKAVTNYINAVRILKVSATAYTGGGITASGKRAQVGRIAVDPRVIKLGTWLYVENYGLAQACDTGGGIKGNKIDLYMNSRTQCFNWGVRNTTVYILALE
jgi:3D (Asp-Asp-Asp) domain-containing protein